MNRNELIHVFATAMALATGGLAFGRSIMPMPDTLVVHAGKKIEVGGRLSARGAAVLSNLDKKLVEIQPNDALRRVERLSLTDGGIGVDLVALAQVLPPDAKVRATGTFGRLFPLHAAGILPHRPFPSVDTLAVTRLSIDGQDVWAAPADQINRLSKLAERRALAWIRALNPHMADGPEAETDSVQVISHDLVVVNVHFVSGWTHQPIPGMTAKLSVSIRNDTVRLVSGRLP